MLDIGKLFKRQVEQSPAPAVDKKEYRTFQENIRCSKCGSHQNDLQYVEDKIEHFNVWCACCGYSLGQMKVGKF